MLRCVNRFLLHYSTPPPPRRGTLPLRRDTAAAMVTIRKYGNRRLYDTRSSRYVNLEDVAELVRTGEDVRVVDAKTDEDLTREVFLQIILEAQGGLDFLPLGLLRRIIRATGTEPANRMTRQQLATALELLHAQMDRVEGQFAKMFPTFFKPGVWPGASGSAPPADAPSPPEPEPPRQSPEPPAEGRKAPPAEAAAGDDLGELRARLEQLEKRLRKE